MLPNLPFYRQLPQVVTVPLYTKQKVAAQKGYYRLRFMTMRLARDIIGTRLYVPAMHFNFIHANGTQQEVVVSPSGYPNASGGGLTNIDIQPKVVSPIFPFNEQQLMLRVGLFAVSAKDLAKEMLDLLSKLTAPAQNPQWLAALGIADSLRQSVNAIFDVDTENGARLAVAWEGELGTTKTLYQTYYVVMPAGPAIDPAKLTFSGGKLFHDGRVLENRTYMVFAVEVTDKYTAWRTLPDIEPAFKAWNSARGNRNLSTEQYNQTVSALTAAIRNSPTLLPDDAERIIMEELVPLLKRGAEADAALYRSMEEAASRGGEVAPEGPTAEDMFHDLDATPQG